METHAFFRKFVPSVRTSFINGPKDEEESSANQPSSLDYTKLSQNLSVFNSASNEAHDDDDDNHLSATERMLKLENASGDG